MWMIAKMWFISIVYIFTISSDFRFTNPTTPHSPFNLTLKWTDPDISPFFRGPIKINVEKISGNPIMALNNVRINLITLEGHVSLSATKFIMEGNMYAGFLSGNISTTLSNFSARLNYTQNHRSLLISQIQPFELSFKGDPLVNSSTGIPFHKLKMREIWDNFSLSLNQQVESLILSRSNLEIQNILKMLQLASFPSEGLGNESRSSLRQLLRQIIQKLRVNQIRLPNLTRSVLGVNLKVTDLYVKGFSDINDIQALFMDYHEKNIHVEFDFTFQKILLSYKLKFINIELKEQKQLLNVRVQVKLVIDLTEEETPQLNYLNINIGSIQNIKLGHWKGLFGIAKDLIMDASEGIRRDINFALNSILKQIIQTELNKVKLEDTIVDLVEKLNGS